MSIALAATLAASMTLPTCSWDRPGANPFMGDVVAAVDRYTDIPEPVRAKLKARMEARQYDEIAAIRRDSVTGKRKYASEIRDMHFGQGTVCRTVTRTKWADDTVERGLVYCESGHCIIVPTVCRNVSRIKRLGSERVASAGDEPLLAPDERLARSAAGDGFTGAGGGGGAGGMPGGGDAPLLALDTVPGAEATAGGGVGGASFQSVAGLPAFSATALEVGGSAMPLLAAAGGSQTDAGTSWTVGAGAGGANPGPVAGIGSVGGLGGSGGNPGNAGRGGNSTDTWGPAGPVPGVGDVGSLDMGPQIRQPLNGVPSEISPVPEPGTWTLGLLGLIGVAAAARRR